MADYDGDGDLDVYLSRWRGWPGPEDPAAGFNRLLRNDGGTFTDVTEAAGGLGACTEEHCLRSVAAAFGDFDRDGDLDLFTGAHGLIAEPGLAPSERPPGEPSFLFENNGDGTFTDISAQLPDEIHRGYTLTGGFFDLDHDGWLDLYLVNDVGTYEPNTILWNHGGTLELAQTETSGLDIGLEGMGLGFGDLNGDLLPDLAVSGWSEVAYLESLAGAGLWLDSTAIRGITLGPSQRVSWGSTFLDLDNDGDLDLLSQFGLLDEGQIGGWGNPEDQPDALWINTGTPTEPSFVEEGAAWGLDHIGVNRGVASVDVNRDGYLDLIRHDMQGELSLYLSRCGLGAWLRFELDQPGTLNRHAVGAEILVTAGDQTWTRTIHAGGTSIGIALPPEAHFGLGEVDVVDRVEIRWPDGAISEIGPVLTRQTVAIAREE